MKRKILKISLVGKTNAGKSTLLNNLVGEKISITNKKINTTEDFVIGIVNINNTQLALYDTPGISFLSENKSSKKSKLKKNLWEGLNQSDIILYLIDSKRIELNDLKNDLPKLFELKKKISIIFNKTDLIKAENILKDIKLITAKYKIDTFFNISAKKKLGFKNLIEYLLKKSKYGEWLFNKDEVSDKDDIFITNECTRNETLSLVHQEIPYNIEVINKTFKYLNNGQLKIKQDIIIKNERYKKILLGRKGSKIKDIRIRSQKEISNILNVKTHLYINIILSNAKKI